MREKKDSKKVEKKNVSESKPKVIPVNQEATVSTPAQFEEKKKNNLPVTENRVVKSNTPVVSYQHNSRETERKSGLKQMIKDLFTPEVDDRYLPHEKTPSPTVAKTERKKVKKWDPVSGDFYFEEEIEESVNIAKETAIKTFSSKSDSRRFSIRESPKKASILIVCMEAGYEKKYFSAFLNNAENICKTKGITLIQFVFFGDTIITTDKLLVAKLKDAKIEVDYEKVKHQKEVLLFDGIKKAFFVGQASNTKKKEKTKTGSDGFDLEELLKKVERERQLNEIGIQTENVKIDGNEYQLDQFSYLFILSGKESGSKVTRQEVKQFFKTIREKNPNIEAILTDIHLLKEVCVLGFRNITTLRLK